jgi:glycosyltransferase involved in cell wall biosynthesis
VKIIYNGIALNKFRNKVSDLDGAIGVLSKSTSTAQIGVISRLTELKGVAYTAEAFVKCLNKVKGDILSMDVTAELESRSVVDRSDITQRMNENTISKLVSTIMKEIKRK